LLDAAKTFLLICAAVFGFRWQLFYLDIPGDALYRALVLEVFRLAFVLSPFIFFLFKRPTQLSSLYILVIGMWAATLYLIYFSVFLPAGFNFSALEVFGKDYLKLVSMAKSFMFLILGLLSLLSFFALLRLRGAQP